MYNTFTICKGVEFGFPPNKLRTMSTTEVNRTNVTNACRKRSAEISVSEFLASESKVVPRVSLVLAKHTLGVW